MIKISKQDKTTIKGEINNNDAKFATAKKPIKFKLKASNGLSFSG